MLREEIQYINAAADLVLKSLFGTNGLTQIAKATWRLITITCVSTGLTTKRTITIPVRVGKADIWRQGPLTQAVAQLNLTGIIMKRQGVEEKALSHFFFPYSGVRS